jgi:hypothetical protein
MGVLRWNCPKLHTSMESWPELFSTPPSLFHTIPPPYRAAPRWRHPSGSSSSAHCIRQSPPPPPRHSPPGKRGSLSWGSIILMKCLPEFISSHVPLFVLERWKRRERRLAFPECITVRLFFFEVLLPSTGSLVSEVFEQISQVCIVRKLGTHLLQFCFRFTSEKHDAAKHCRANIRSSLSLTFDFISPLLSLLPLCPHYGSSDHCSGNNQSKCYEYGALHECGLG